MESGSGLPVHGFADSANGPGSNPRLPEFFEQWYEELRMMARMQFAAQPRGATLQPTALVHEVFVKLSRSAGLRVEDEEHFLALAARVMRQVLVDEARRRATSDTLVHLDRALAPGRAGTSTTFINAIALDEAIEVLSQRDARKATVLECRIFGGMTLDQTAVAVGISRSTAAEDWRFARAWLISRLSGGPAP